MSATDRSLVTEIVRLAQIVFITVFLFVVLCIATDISHSTRSSVKFGRLQVKQNTDCLLQQGVCNYDNIFEGSKKACSNRFVSLDHASEYFSTILYKSKSSTLKSWEKICVMCGTRAGMHANFLTTKTETIPVIAIVSFGWAGNSFDQTRDSDQTQGIRGALYSLISASDVVAIHIVIVTGASEASILTNWLRDTKLDCTKFILEFVPLDVKAVVANVSKFDWKSPGGPLSHHSGVVC